MAGSSAAAKKAWATRRSGGGAAKASSSTSSRKKTHGKGKVKTGYKAAATKGQLKMGKVGNKHLTPAGKATKARAKGSPAERAARIGRKITARHATDVRAARGKGKKAGSVAGANFAKSKGTAARRRAMLSRASKAMGL